MGVGIVENPRTYVLINRVTFNPIPTSTGRNQPIYEYHMITTGRNRVKYKITARDRVQTHSLLT